MNHFRTVLLGAALPLLIAFTTGCSPHHMVILTPDPDGHVGKAVVSTDRGMQLLELSHGMTTVSGGSSAPTPVTVVSQEFISATFAEVLAIEPAPAEKFILYFHSNTTDLVPESKTTLSNILSTIKRRGAISICISGHTDATGSVQLNDDLAHNRAQAISELLIQQGVDRKNLTVSSHGKGNQLVPTADGVAEPRNRRVEVIVR